MIRARISAPSLPPRATSSPPSLRPPTAMRPACLTAFLLLCASPAAAQATPVLHGTVVDARSGQPIAGAVVRTSLYRKAVSDTAGAFTLCRLPEEVARVAVYAEGYRSAAQEVEVAAGDSLRVRLPLERAAPGDPPYLSLEESWGEGERAVVLVDGVRGYFPGRDGCAHLPPGALDVTGIDPDDITAIEVLRAREAVGRYGAEAEAGLVIITTRRARP